MRLVSGAELRSKLEKGEKPKLVFVLGEWQYEAMRIPGSLNIPCSPGLFASNEAFGELEEDDEIVVYCSNETCWASISTYYLLESRGFKNVSRYAGGLLDWMGEGYPLEGKMSLLH